MAVISTEPPDDFKAVVVIFKAFKQNNYPGQGK